MNNLLGHSKKTNNLKSGAQVAHRKMLHDQAAARNAEYAKLTPVQKLAKLDLAGHTATKQRTKLLAQIAAADAKVQSKGKVSHEKPIRN